MLKNILLGVTGGIAAYKSAELVRLIRKSGAEVKVIMTKAAQEFITPLTMQTLSGNIVYDDMFKRLTDNGLEHIELARWADAILVAPATANFIARLTHGFADDLLACVCLASQCPIAIAPAMNKNMWKNQITQENLNKIKQRGVYIFGPGQGVQACGDVGYGRMLEPQEIITHLEQIWAKKLLVSKKILITAGPTHEAIDPVRYISNRSSGKMGYALAKAAKAAGAEVILISGPTNLTPPDNIEFIVVETAKEMYEAVMSKVAQYDVFIATAAVADYSPVETKHKIKKTQSSILLELHQNLDILASVTALANPPFTVGFAAETDNVLSNALEKLKNKKIDMIIANEVGKNKGFQVDDNALTVLTKSNDAINLPLAKKDILAGQVIDIIAKNITLCY